MTNYERIKAMSVEEMAEDFFGDCDHCAYLDKRCNEHEDMRCEKGVELWLNSEVEE